MAILVTGGTGYIGSHTVLELLAANYEVVIVDNLSNSKKVVIKRLEAISGKSVRFYEVDCTDYIALEKVFIHEKITDVIHFAGLKAVGESVRYPLKYYENNLNSTLVLLSLMEKYHVPNLIFSSSATVYGIPQSVPIKESDPIGGTTNPYGTTKLFNEKIIEDYVNVHSEAKAIMLRYFNPIGAHPSGLIGEDPSGIPNNLMPYITQVAVGKRVNLGVFGHDYKTIDGTGVRDYIHVVDLAKGHLAALKKLQEDLKYEVYNLGTGKGTSVLEMINAFEVATKIKIPYVMMDRRPGDIDELYANCDKAKIQLHWEAKLNVFEACRDSWNYQKKHPEGYLDE